MGTDRLSRIICDSLNLRAYAVQTPETAREIVTSHQASPLAAISMARAVNACALLIATLKPESDQNLSLKFSGSGPLKELHVQADAKGNMRGYIARPGIGPDDAEGGTGFGHLIGAGFLTIIKNIGLREPYYSTTPLMAGDIARDLAYYLTFSEQTPSAVIIGATMDDDFRISASGGILVQVFPDTDPSVIIEVEDRILSNQSSLGAHLQSGGDIHEYLSGILGGAPFTIAGGTDLRHNCRCSRDMLAGIVGGFDAAELEDMIHRDGGAEIECTFCRKKYHFSREELISIASSKKETGLN